VCNILEMVALIKEKYLLPTGEDYDGAVIALHRLQDTYQLSAKDIRTGNLSKNYPSRQLSGTFIRRLF
jgi:hypothetical protein